MTICLVNYKRCILLRAVISFLVVACLGKRHSAPTYNLHPQQLESVVPSRFFKTGNSGAPKEYDYTINYRMTICGKERSPYLLFVIRSATKHFERRDAIRRTWGGQRTVGGHRIKCVFLLGLPIRDPILQNRIIEESENELDIVQASFHDTYANLTLKDVSAFKWASNNCPHATFVAVASDEIFVDVVKLLNLYLPAHYADLREISFCYLFPCCTRVYSTESESKYRVQNGQYEGRAYPRYCSGTLYVAPMSVVRELHAVALDTPAFMPDDAWIGVLLEKLGIEPRDTYTAFAGIARDEALVAERFTTSDYGVTNLTVAVLDYAYPGKEHDKVIEIWHSLLRSRRHLQGEIAGGDSGVSASEVALVCAVVLLAYGIYFRRRRLC